MQKIAVFCGSHTGHSPLYGEISKALVDVLYDKGITLVYGGAKAGLMGIIADHMMKKGGEVIGVIPQSLSGVELMHEGLTQLHIVETMHERKALMEELADGFIMLPGGTGSLDEFFEMFTWAQLSFHAKPCGILDIDGYYGHLLSFLDHAVTQGFLTTINRDMLISHHMPEVLIQKIITYQAPCL